MLNWLLLKDSTCTRWWCIPHFPYRIVNIHIDVTRRGNTICEMQSTVGKCTRPCTLQEIGTIRSFWTTQGVSFVSNNRIFVSLDNSHAVRQTIDDIDAMAE